ncbi:hypothetical protein, partial [Pseudomonas amygdali]|uniref:hypothetical protein n=1 Tax=Pseudomonas amygdali TaxID=47877 RepID=UPI001EE3CFE6
SGALSNSQTAERRGEWCADGNQLHLYWAGMAPGDGFVDNKIEQTKEKVNGKPSIRWFVFFSVSQPHETMRFYG